MTYISLSSKFKDLTFFLSVEKTDLLTMSDDFLSFFFVNFRFLSSSCSNLKFWCTKTFTSVKWRLENTPRNCLNTHWMRCTMFLQVELSVSSPVFVSLLGHRYMELLETLNTRASEDSLVVRSFNTCLRAFLINISKWKANKSEGSQTFDRDVFKSKKTEDMTFKCSPSFSITSTILASPSLEFWDHKFQLMAFSVSVAIYSQYYLFKNYHYKIFHTLKENPCPCLQSLFVSPSLSIPYLLNACGSKITSGICRDDFIYHQGVISQCPSNLMFSTPFSDHSPLSFRFD